MKFNATVRLDGKTATGIEVPTAVLADLGGGKRPRVRVSINGYTYRTTVGSMGGRSLVPVSADVRTQAGISAGDRVAVDIVPDTEERSVRIPADLTAALDRARVRNAFDKLSYSNQHRHVLSVEGAKSPETRQRRIERVLDEVRKGAQK
jgi:Domain of unknown function (DUF1905)/Bacteriocin-protection, YdeI or OmpD-Associated